MIKSFILAIISALIGLEIGDILWDIQRRWHWAIGKHIFLMSTLLLIFFWVATS